MYRKISNNILLWLVCLGAACAATGCNPDDNGPSERAAKVNVELSKYYNEKEDAVTMLWKVGDEAGLMQSGPGKSPAYFAMPIAPGSARSLFLFTLDIAADTEGTFVGFYPKDAGVVLEDGVVKTKLPARQTGEITPLMLGRTTGKPNSYAGLNLTLEHLFSTFYVNVGIGEYTVDKVTVRGNNGENIAGDITVDIDGWTVESSEKTITVELPVPLDASKEALAIPVMIAPVTLEGGYTVTISTTEGKTVSVVTDEPVTFTSGGSASTDNVRSLYAELVLCGNNMVYMINADVADETGYAEAVTWSWDAAVAAPILGLAVNRMDHIDDCKPVDRNRKLLVTSSYSWCVLLDIETEDVLFHTSKAGNAHSAELLPNNRIAVACSTGSSENHNKIQVYDISRPNTVLFGAELNSAHGVVWNETTQRLYAVGGQDLRIYKLKDWDTANPSLELEKVVKTPQAGLHDLTYVNSNTLCVAGRKSFLYDIGAGTFTEMTHFTNSTALKSVNYNDNTGEVWYTDATVPEGSQTWSSQTIRHAAGANATSTDRTIKVPDLDMYKVRVMSW